MKNALIKLFSFFYFNLKDKQIGFNMKVKVYFCKESDTQIILKKNRLSKQALDTIYDLVWESEFKNILNAGRIWLKFVEEEKPFGIPLKEKRSHNRISFGDLIQIADKTYMANKVGIKEIIIIEQKNHRKNKTKQKITLICFESKIVIK